jgi:hypothetical protein
MQQIAAAESEALQGTGSVVLNQQRRSSRRAQSEPDAADPHFHGSIESFVRQSQVN